LFGGAAWVRYDDVARANFCAAVPALNQATVTSCNPNFSTGQIGLVTRWTPVKNLTFSAEAMYFMLHQNIQGSAVFTPGGAQPAQTYTFHDQSTASFNVRVQRNF
jgi:hypothetical protein